MPAHYYWSEKDVNDMDDYGWPRAIQDSGLTSLDTLYSTDAVISSSYPVSNRGALCLLSVQQGSNTFKCYSRVRIKSCTVMLVTWL